MNAVEGLRFESFYDVMSTASTIDLAYKYLFPNSIPEKELYGQRWENIKSVTSKVKNNTVSSLDSTKTER